MFRFKTHFRLSPPNLRLRLLPRMVMSTGSSSRRCAVNTDTAATHMARDSSRLQRALSTPTRAVYHQIRVFSLQEKKKKNNTSQTCNLTCLWFPWRSASSARRSGSPAAGRRTAGGRRAAPGWSSPTGGSQSRSERRISLCMWSCGERGGRVLDTATAESDAEMCCTVVPGDESWKMKGLTDSKAMDSQRTLPPCIPTAPWDSCPGSRLGSGREWHSGWSRGRIDDSLLPEKNRRRTSHFDRLMII